MATYSDPNVSLAGLPIHCDTEIRHKMPKQTKLDLQTQVKQLQAEVAILQDCLEESNPWTFRTLSSVVGNRKLAQRVLLVLILRILGLQ